MAVYTLGIYRIAAEHLFPGYSCQDIDAFWYLHLVQRTGQFLYKAYMGETRKELESTTVTTEVTSDQLEHAEFLGSPMPISYYVAPASVLPHYLRVQFSAAGLFYFHLAGPRDEDGFQPVRIVALAERLSNPQTRSYIVDFSDEELRQATVLTPELRRLATSDLSATVGAYAESKVINHQLYSNPTARKFAAVFDKATEESLKVLQQLPAKGRASIQEDYSPFVLRDRATQIAAEETALQSSIERGKLTLEKLEDLQRELEEPLFCLLEDRKPLEAVEVFEEETEIEPVFVSQKMAERVCKAARPDDPFSRLTWRRKMALRSALWEINQQLTKKHLQAAKRQALEEQSWAIRLALVNEQSSNYNRVQILPVAASSVTLKGYFVHLYRKAA